MLNRPNMDEVEKLRRTKRELELLIQDIERRTDQLNGIATAKRAEMNKAMVAAQADTAKFRQCPNCGQSIPVPSVKPYIRISEKGFKCIVTLQFKDNFELSRWLLQEGLGEKHEIRRQ
uniref:Uncharacterized protein n=1 Tax=Trichuris muris TaxID=70415 RepID=A0A5S6QR59_TRIMR